MIFQNLATAAVIIASAAAINTVQLNRHDVPIVKNGVIVAHKTAFFGKIYVGRPAQPFTVVFDTGSGHVILPSATCESETCTEKRRYNPLDSDTAQNIPSIAKLLGKTPTTQSTKGAREHVAITFGTGQVTGEFVSDKVCLSESAEDSCVSARLVAATQMTEDPFKSFKFDGVLGLSLARLSLTPEFNFFGQMANQSQADFQSQFAVFLSSTPSVPSEISFGGYQPSRLAEPLKWAPVADPEHGYWNLKLKSVTVGEERLAVCDEGNCRAILDSGTSLLGVPRTELRRMHRLLARVLPEDHGEVDCRTWEGPNIVFDFGTFQVTVTAKDYSRMGPANMLVAGGGPNMKRDFCRASLLPVDLQEPLGPAAFIMGEPVLRRFYTVFDYGRKQVGLGLAKQPEPSSQSSEMQESVVV
jgi:hypothetical protein